MKSKSIFIIILILISLVSCLNEDIISFPADVDSYKMKTKFGNIQLEIFHSSKNSEITNSLLLIGIKNLDLYNPPDVNGISIIKENYIIKFIIFDNNLNKLNSYLCDLFYQTHYIKKKIYTIENNSRNNPYKYFGGTPKNIIENLNKYEFQQNEVPSLYLFRCYEGQEEEDQCLKIEFNPLDPIEFNEEYEKNCAKSMLDEWREYFWDFDVIKYKFEIPVINFRKKNMNGIFKDDFYEYPCEKLILGSKFLELINVREFNLENGKVTLYTTKDSDLLSNKLF